MQTIDSHITFVSLSRVDERSEDSYKGRDDFFSEKIFKIFALLIMIFRGQSVVFNFLRWENTKVSNQQSRFKLLLKLTTLCLKF